jgi:hypothetical protein
MKRSEMLLKLMEMMVEAPEDIEVAANDILTRLERAGMKPPKDGPYSFSTHDWTPEDEDNERSGAV